MTLYGIKQLDEKGECVGHWQVPGMEYALTVVGNLYRAHPNHRVEMEPWASTVDRVRADRDSRKAATSTPNASPATVSASTEPLTASTTRPTGAQVTTTRMSAERAVRANGAYGKGGLSFYSYPQGIRVTEEQAEQGVAVQTSNFQDDVRSMFFREGCTGSRNCALEMYVSPTANYLGGDSKSNYHFNDEELELIYQAVKRIRKMRRKK